MNRKAPPSKMQTTTCKRAACGLAVPPYQRANPYIFHQTPRTLVVVVLQRFSKPSQGPPPREQVDCVYGMGLQYSNSLFASSQYLPIPSVALHLRKRWKRNILINGKRNGARSPYVSFLETRNAQGGTFIVSWKRNTRKIRVCFLCFLFPVFRLRP